MTTSHLFFTYENLYGSQSEKIGNYEFQFCKGESPIKQISKSKIKFNDKGLKPFQKDSLYIINDANMASIEIFFNYYNEYFANPTTPDGNHVLDYNGINYFTKEQTLEIYNTLRNKKLYDVEMLLNWLKECVEKYNGFYFWGI